MSSKASHRLVIGLAFVVAAAFLRFSQLEEKSLWNDEMFSFDVANSPLHEIQSKLIANYHHPPFFFYLLHFVLMWLGQSAWALRLLSAVAGSLTVGVVYVSAASLVNQRAGIISALLCMASPFHLAYSQEGRPYALAGLLCLLDCYVMSLILQEPRRIRMLFYVVSSLALLYTHHWGIFVLVSHAAFILLFARTDRSIKMTFLVLWVITATFYVPEIFALMRQLSTRADAGWWWAEYPSVKEVVDLAGAFSGSYFKMASSVFDLSLPVNYIAGVALVISLLTALVVAFKKDGEASLRGFLVSFVITLLLPFVISFFRPEAFLWYRYTVIVFPIFCVCIGGTIASRSWKHITIGTIALLLTVNLLGAVKYFSWQKSNVKDVASYVESVTRDNVKLLIRPRNFAPLLNYYYKGTSIQLDETYLDQPLGQIIDTAASFTYVSLDVPNEIRDYMDRHFTKIAERKFPGEAHLGMIVGVYKQKREVHKENME